MNKRALWLAVLVFGSAPAGAASRLVALAVDDRMTVMVGKYDTRHGWIQSTDFYEPPQPGDPFALYGPLGLVAVVRVTDHERAYPGGVFASWTANLSSWDNRQTPWALAVSGERPFSTDLLPATPISNPEFRAMVSRHLKSKGLIVDAPRITEAVELPVFGHREIVVVAQSDPKKITAEKPGEIYSVCLLWWRGGPDERVEVLSTQTSFKPAGRSIEEHERFNGRQESLHILGAEDIDEDRWREIVITHQKEDAVQVDVFAFNGRRLKMVLSAYKADYN